MERVATELVVTTQEGSGANTACDQSIEAHDTQEKKTQETERRGTNPNVNSDTTPPAIERKKKKRKQRLVSYLSQDSGSRQDETGSRRSSRKHCDEQNGGCHVRPHNASSDWS